MNVINVNGLELWGFSNGTGVLKISVCANRLANNDSKIGTWNVRVLKITGKMALIEMEVNKIDLLILGSSKTHWDGNGEITLGKEKFFFSLGKRGHKGVAIVVMRNTEMWC